MSERPRRPMTEEERALGLKYPIVVVDADPAWPLRFAEERARLRALLPAGAIGRIEHFGSTAVPGLAAKPVIDLLAEVPSFEAARRDVIPVLEGAGWIYMWRADVEPGHMNFVNGYGADGYLDGVQLYHLHAAPAGHPFWERLLFRDHLRAHPADVARYADLKRRLAREFRNDREGYTDAKTELIDEMVARARGERA